MSSSPRLFHIWTYSSDDVFAPEHLWTVSEFDAKQFACEMWPDGNKVALKDVPTLLKTAWKQLGDRLHFVGFGAPEGHVALTKYNDCHVLLADPAEICAVDSGDDGVRWSDGHHEPLLRVDMDVRDKIDAYRSFCSFLILVSRVEPFCSRDGDHAVATRVMRFLVKPEFLKRD